MEQKSVEPTSVEPTLSTHKKMLTDMIETTCLYLNHVHNDYAALIKEKKEFTDAEKKHLTQLQFQIACLLDLMHKSYPACYDLFPKHKDNLDTILKLHHNYQKSGVLRKCECNLCEDVVIPGVPVEEMKPEVEKTEPKETATEG